MPTREPISTPDIDVTHVVTVLVDTVKYDSINGSRGVMEEESQDEDIATPMMDVVHTSTATQSESSNSLGKVSQSREFPHDFTSVRIPTYFPFYFQIDW